MSQGQQEFQDPYEVRIGIPTSSWKYARKGEGWRGILLPQGGLAYRLSQQTNIAGELLWWESPTGRRPRVQQDMLFGFMSLNNGTKLGPADFISNKASERFDQAAQSGDPDAIALIDRVNKFGLRRQIIKGESLEKGMKEAVAKLAPTLGPKPVAGAIVGITLDKLVPNEHQGETKIYVITYEAPTDASKAKVQEYLASLPQEGDPYSAPGGNAAPASAPAGSGAPAEDDEPPF